MWQFLKPQQIPPNMSEVDYIKLSQEREAYRKEIQALKGEISSMKAWSADNENTRMIIKGLEDALSDAREEARMWRREAMKNITR